MARIRPSRRIDGANCVDSNNHSLLLSHRSIRIFLPYLPITPMKAVPQFEGYEPSTILTTAQLSDAAAQQACVDSNGAGVQCLSMYRRPLPPTNLAFLTTTMWDGREPNPAVFGLDDSLTSQAADATLDHAQTTTPPSASQLAQIVALEMGLFSVKLFDFLPGPQAADGAEGGPQEVSELASTFIIGIK